MAEHKIILTEDGSHSIFAEQFGVSFHSTHGALQESQHVFIDSGLLPLIVGGKKRLRILEVGLGTGSSALLSALIAEEHFINIEYTGLEAFPIEESIFKSLNYGELIAAPNAQSIFEKIHQAPWERLAAISDHFSIVKYKIQFADFKAKKPFDLIYFDAFDPGTQPELWTTAALRPFIQALPPSGVLTTYSAKGAVRRSFIELGCTVERIPGPPGKREMLRATKALH